MNKLQTVYIPIDQEWENGKLTLMQPDGEWSCNLEEKQAYVFTPEELKQLLEEYTNRIVENAKTMPICGKNHEACNMPYCDTCSEVVDKESITSQLPKFLKEIGI